MSVSISGFGQDGPYRDRPAHDLSFMALAGLLETPADGRAPAVPALSLADLAAGLFGAIAALTGLAARGSSGRGGHYDVAMFDALISLLTTLVVPPLNGGPAEGLGDDPGYGVYATADREWLTLSIAFEDHFWRALCGTTPALEPYAGVDASERAARSAELRAVLAQAIGRRPIAEWEALLGAADVPHAAVRTPSAVADDPQVIARQLLTSLPGGRQFVRQPLVVDGVTAGPRSDAPALGEHTQAVLAELGAATTR
ncbi:Acetyl-CoA:oxalate CoA-transferase [Paraconexibacter sp. AEG42_29]|uniref:Acetyl-CoA:oxalate CoA-transferase n=1 Tax=Paraconexibacter sp. AEG42_29 TaxID=2997339 RepID=A0AAU7ATU1_9ACTN